MLFFLTATSIGLITTFIKVAKIKNLWYLFRKNTSIAFVILIFTSTINWDKIITSYNIKYATQMDLKYLLELSNNNALLLKENVDANVILATKKQQIENKYNYYITELENNSWQEMVYDNLNFKK